MEKENSIKKPFIIIEIHTSDKDENFVKSVEKRIFHGPENPSVRDYCEIFTNVLSKQEFSNGEIIDGLKTFFIDTDKESLSK